MMAQSQIEKMSVEAYLEWESGQELRHEYVNGRVFAMTGGTLSHNDIAINLLGILRSHIRAQGCRINIADVKVRISSSIYRYPDLIVSCDEQDRSALNAIQFPKLIVEVLSPGTEALDRGKKFREYRSLATLEEYVLISSTQISVEVYRRGEGRLWLYRAYQAEEQLKLESIGYELSVDQIYENVFLSDSLG